MLTRVLDAGVPASWAAADGIYGQNVAVRLDSIAARYGRTLAADNQLVRYFCQTARAFRQSGPGRD